MAKKIALAQGASNYNLLQNNGRLARNLCARFICTDQVVDHVHFHVIPKNEGDGLVMDWDALSLKPEEMSQIAKDLAEKIANL